MTNLPDEIMVWRSMEKLTHIGTWATKRYPAEVVAYIPRAEAEAAMAAVVERCAEVAQEGFMIVAPEEVGQRMALDSYRAQIRSNILALAPASGLAMLAELRERAEKAESHAKSTNCVWQRNLELIAERDTLAADLAAEKALCAGAEANLKEVMVTAANIAAANAALEARVAGLREAVDEQTKARAQHWLRRTMTAPEDAEVEALCERCGYGAVMDAASRLWARKPHGSGAFYIGGCIGFKSDEEARAALASGKPGEASLCPVP